MWKVSVYDEYNIYFLKLAIRVYKSSEQGVYAGRSGLSRQWVVIELLRTSVHTRTHVTPKLSLTSLLTNWKPALYCVSKNLQKLY